MDTGRLVESEETFDKQIVSNLSVDSSTCVSEQYDSLSDEENSNQSSSLDYSLSSTSHSVSSGTNFNYSVENLKLSLSTNGNSASNNRMMNASLIVGGNETNLMSESFVNHSQVIVSNVGHSNHAFLPVVLQVSNEEPQPKSNIVTFDKESCKDSVNIVNSIQKMMESQSKVEPEPCLFKHDNFRPIIKLSPQKHALFLKKKKMNRRETILNQVKLSSRLTGNKHSCRIGPAKRKDLSLDQIKNQRLDKKNNFHLELDLDILFTEKLVEKLPILVESSNQITETLFEMKDEKQTTPLTESPTNSTSSTSSPHHPCNFSCKYCNELNRNCTINNSIKETQHEVFNIVKYNLVKLKELLDSDDLDFEDSVDSVLESDCVQTLISYLDTSIYGKYFSLKKEGHSNSNSMSNLSMKDILSLQLVATQVVKKLSCGRIDQVETLTSKLTISKLILLINSMCDSVRYEALWICGNLAKHHHNFRDDLLDQNVLNEIVTLITGFSGSNLDEDTTSLLRMAAWCFSKLCFGTVFPKENHMRKEIELLDKFLAFEDSDILKNVCRALGRLMLPKEMIDVFLKTGRLPKIVDLLKHVDDNVIGQALVAAVNISAGTDEETQELVTLNALNVCHDILKSNKSRSIKVDAMILVSNIAACTEKQVECAVECGVLELVANLFHNRDTHIDMKKEAVWIFSNSTSNGTEQHLELFTEKYQILIPVAKMVMNCNDTNVVTLGLQTLLRIVQYYDEDKEPEQLAGVLAKLNECGADKYISQMDVNRYGTAAKLNKYFPKK